ncbi:PilZ domain-containing protein [Methylobacterium trifolii]|uniref:PilZ domain-containing protein n=1 Tax=Methylobacterium trifolii TaxID=1003092 RepID=A0ABQ4TY44_9HYPH|nr:PilZ domain-containing protein [Methylobacterium trifolii]GJE60181.1 hypothetical protein MPOCJGCO_2292 [Methylobacterium trifolii]
MQDRRADARHRVDENGLITIDEHTSIPCLIYDLSSIGARLVSLDTQAVPQTFLLSAGRFGAALVCSVMWRTAEEIGARFDRAAA